MQHKAGQRYLPDEKIVPFGRKEFFHCFWARQKRHVLPAVGTGPFFFMVPSGPPIVHLHKIVISKNPSAKRLIWPREEWGNCQWSKKYSGASRKIEYAKVLQLHVSLPAIHIPRRQNHSNSATIDSPRKVHAIPAHSCNFSTPGCWTPLFADFRGCEFFQITLGIQQDYEVVHLVHWSTWSTWL